MHPNQHYLYAEKVSTFCSELYFKLIFGNIAVVCAVPLIFTIYFYAVNDVLTEDIWILPVPMYVNIFFFYISVSVENEN